MQPDPHKPQSWLDRFCFAIVLWIGPVLALVLVGFLIALAMEGQPCP